LLESKWRALPKVTLGSGSNVLFVDDYPGVVIKVNILGKSVLREDDDHVWLRIGAGESWHATVLFCVANNFAGIENLSLIPGSVGAAPIQNIGAYGVEFEQIFDSLTALSITDGRQQIFDAKACQFGYRSSVFKTTLKDQYIITDVTLKLSKTPKYQIEYGAIQETLTEMGISQLSIAAISNAIIKIRQSKLPDPLVLGNAGSFFKNIEISKERFTNLQSKFPAIPYFPTASDDIKIPAAWLIEQCGYKGKRVGNIGVYDKQALVLVNYGNGKGREILALAKEICSSVYDKFEVELVNEVNII